MSQKGVLIGYEWPSGAEISDRTPHTACNKVPLHFSIIKADASIRLMVPFKPFCHLKGSESANYNRKAQGSSLIYGFKFSGWLICIKLRYFFGTWNVFRTWCQTVKNWELAPNAFSTNFFIFIKTPKDIHHVNLFKKLGKYSFCVFAARRFHWVHSFPV